MIKRVFRQMLVTQILSSMTVMICMLIDSIMIGRFLGVDSMTAYGLATPVLLVFAAFGSMLSAGIQVKLGKTMGSGDMEGTNGCYTVSFFLAAAVSVVGLAAVLIFTNPICTLLGAGSPTPDNKIFALTRDYIRGFIIGAPAFMFAQIMVPFMQISGSRVRLIVAVAAMTVGDVLFDIFNVNNLLFFDGSTFGMGLASSLSYYIAFVIGIAYFFKKKCMFKFRVKLINAKKCFELLKYGVPTVINQISTVLLVFVLNKVLLDVGGDGAVAAYSVISTIGNICYCVGAGIASVALMLSSIFYSDEDRTELRSLVKTMTFYALVLDAALIVFALLFAPYLALLFLADESAVNMAANGLRLFSLSLLSCSLNTVFKNYYQGVNKAGFTQAISVMQNFAFTALFAFVLSRFLGITGVWISFLCGETLTLLIIAAVVWIKYKKISFSPDAFMLLPRDFGAREGDYIEMSFDTPEGPVDVSNKAGEFCRAHGESNRNSNLISLCIEEMSNNIVQHGFTKDAKKHSVDIRLLFKNGKKLIRIRDNCVNFDPINYIELHKTDDPTSHIGIRMVMKMVKNANYVNSLGLNNLTLEL
ncbi:MAG: ATP-binding protein [Clostridia bacterium]|nr:ATP-binding protein [Clostridia bacterium]